MIRSDDLMKGVAIGLGVAVLTPMIIAALTPVAKPIVRSALKAGIRSYEKGRESLELFNEAVDDIMAEVEEEMTAAPAEEAVVKEEPVVSAVKMAK